MKISRSSYSALGLAALTSALALAPALDAQTSAPAKVGAASSGAAKVSAASSGAAKVSAASSGAAKVSAASSGAAGAKKRVTLERIHSEPPIAPRGASQFRWLSETRLVYLLPEGVTTSSGPGAGAPIAAFWEYDVLTKKRTRLVGPAVGAPPLPLKDALWAPDGKALLLRIGNDLHLMDVTTHNVKRLTNDSAEEEYPTFAPSGTHIAFVKGNDPHPHELATG